MPSTVGFFLRVRSSCATLTRVLTWSSLAVVLLSAHRPVPLGAQSAGWMAPTPQSSSMIQRLVDDFRTRLAIDPPIAVSVVPTNARIVSVSPPRASDQAFELVIERAFLNVLSDDELSAVIAHELGHVWVSTHHPYLQTELLANTIAMRVVTRESLERVYEKMWSRDGRKGDLLRFLGPAPAEPVVADLVRRD